MTNRDLAAELLADLRTAAGFLTRLPLRSDANSDLARAGRAYPIVGAMIGLITGGAYWSLCQLGAPPLAAAAAALGAGALLTGALHEDGLADLADGFGGGTRDRKLEIMRDSRIGVFGVLALVTTFAIKVAALASFAPQGGVVVLVVAHALARAPLPLLSTWLPLARSDGLAHGVGDTSGTVALTALALGAVIAIIALPFAAAGIALAATVAGAFAVGWIALHQIGGRTGDVLGAAEQVAETAILLLLAARPL